MTLKVSEMTTPREKGPRIPEGTKMARICSIVDLGIQPQTDWKTKEVTKSQPRVLISWELPTETIDIEDEDGNVTTKPRWISKEYTISSYEMSNLYKLIKVLKPGIETLDELLGMACMVTVGSTENDNAKVTAVVPVPDGMPVADLEQDGRYFDFDSPTKAGFTVQPEWVRDNITGAENYTGFADEWAA